MPETRAAGAGSGAGRGPGRSSAHPFVLDIGGVLAAWAVLLALENLVVGLAYRQEFVGAWEMAHARRYLSPLALGASFPLALLAVVFGRLAGGREARTCAGLAAIFGAVLGYGVSTGRHLASWAVRAPFLAGVALVAAAVAYVAVTRAPLGRPRRIAAAGAAIAGVAWLADAFVLPRLYPAFHLALFAVTLGGWATTWLLVRELRHVRARTAVATVGLAVTILSLAASQREATAVAGDDNLRRVLLERAPLLGRAVRVAAHIAPPPPLDEGDVATTAAIVAGAAPSRSLDWRGHDIVLVTIDALRADHVSSYGYPRPTTPNIDRLAAKGARFSHAYCPTPHTSYSVTSMMTGKYMRPLLAMGAGDDSETWASYLRRYGFRTAAFYPPAVFFIDEHRFRKMEESGLGFEYRKVEFAKPAVRRAQIAAYLADVPQDRSLFLWLHLFEPHEPYEMHPDHPFSGDETSDAYDSEIAEADAQVGEVVRLVDERRPGAVVVISADHGEELGDHGGRYHGTTVYEEQVRVPLVIVGPGVLPRVVTAPVQTIDLLPTTLAALDIPMPARLRGRDLGPALTGKVDEGLAFAETDDWTLVARGDDRLVCARKVASCTLFDVAGDPGEKRAVVDRPEREKELRRLTAAIERENGKLEANPLPEALRRGLQGDRDAAEDVAPLLDDARVDIRRAAARCGFRLRAPEMAPALRRAAARDEDAEVGAWARLALYRLGEGVDARAIDAALRGPDPAIRVAAALAFAEQGDARGEAELVARWEAAFSRGARVPGEIDEARELLAAMAKLRARSATRALLGSLDDVRLRPFVVEALGEIGDARARGPLLAIFAGERYLNARPKEARALLALGAKKELRGPLARFAGVPEPMPEAIAVAREAGLLADAPDARRWDVATPTVHETLASPPGDVARVLVLVAPGPGELSVQIDGRAVPARRLGSDTWAVEVGPRRGAEGGTADGRDGAKGVLAIDARHPAGVLALWVVPRAEEIPPPAPREWDAGAP